MAGMTQETFTALVARLEDVARRNPRRYAARVLGFALLGYGYILGVLLLLLLLLAGILAVVILERRLPGGIANLILGLCVLIVVILRALWIRLSPPEGIRPRA